MIKLATVIQVSSAGVTVKFEGEDKQSSLAYSYNKSVSFNIGDRVVCFAVSGTYIVGFKI